MSHEPHAKRVAGYRREHVEGSRKTGWVSGVTGQQGTEGRWDVACVADCGVGGGAMRSEKSEPESQGLSIFLGPGSSSHGHAATA